MDLPALPAVALLRRDLLLQMRRTRALVLMLVFLVLVSLIILVNWPKGEVVWGMLGYTSRGIVTAGIVSTFAAAVILVPGLAAGTIVSERDRRTWETLTLTLIRPAGMVAAKVLSSSGFFLLYVIAVVPILSAIFFLVGVDWIQLWLSLVVILATALTCGCIGVACGVLFHRPLKALVFSYAGMLVVLGAPLLLFQLALALADEFGIAPGAFILSGKWMGLSAIVAVAEAANGGSVSTVVQWNLTYQAVLALLALLLAWWRMRKPAAPPAVVRRRSIEDPSELRRRRRRFPFYLIDPLQQRASIADNVNPVYAKERYWGAFTFSTAGIRIVVAACLFSFMIHAFIVSTFMPPTDFVLLCAGSLNIHGVFLCLTILVIFAGAYAREFEQRNVDAIRSTLLLPRDIVEGKYLAARRIVIILIGCCALSQSPFIAGAIVLVDTEALWTLAAGYYNVALCAFLALNLTLLASMRAKTLMGAMTRAFVTTCLLFFGSGVVALFGLGAFGEFDDIWVALGFYGNPALPYLFTVFDVNDVDYVGWWTWDVSMLCFTPFVFYFQQRATAYFAQSCMRDP
ncbi:MAG: hypothetical protein AAB353_04160 [Candidatus Hydrogenedentota bacterium]